MFLMFSYQKGESLLRDLHGARGAVAERKQCCTHRRKGLVSLALARVHSPQRARSIRNEGTLGVPRGDGAQWANEERTSAPCPDTCQTNLRGVVNSCREPPLYSTLSSLQSGASRTVPLFVVPMRVHCNRRRRRAGVVFARGQARTRTRRKTGRDAIGPESKPWAGTSRARRVRGGEGRLNSEPGGGLGPSSGKDGGQTLRQRATGCG